MILVAVNLDPHHAQEAALRDAAVGVGSCPTTARSTVEDLMRGDRFVVARARSSTFGSIRPTLPFAIWRIAAAMEASHERDRQAADASWPNAVSDPLWYKDAIIYQLHVKSFFDSNNDGIGDFPGPDLASSTTSPISASTRIWLLPFYPSPRRDDGYDIAEYRAVHPDYGTMADVRRFIEAAHRARHPRHHRAGDQPHLRPASLVPARAPAPSRARAARDFYVWSDTDQKYAGTRIIFLDTETLELDLGPGRQRLLLAPLLLAPARPQFRQSRGAQGGAAASCASGSTWASTGCGSTPCPI